MHGVKARLQNKYPQKPNLLLAPMKAIMKQRATYTIALTMAHPCDLEFACRYGIKSNSGANQRDAVHGTTKRSELIIR